MAGVPEADAAVAFSGNPETMRKHYLNLDEVAIADQVVTQMGAYQGVCVGIAPRRNDVTSLLVWRLSSSPTRTRTLDKAVNSRLLYQLSYRGMISLC
jgi:hypothetical protein